MKLIKSILAMVGIRMCTSKISLDLSDTIFDVKRDEYLVPLFQNDNIFFNQEIGIKVIE